MNQHTHGSPSGSDQQHAHHHHILPVPTALAVGGALLVLTIITVAVAGIDLGRLNFLVAFFVASVKATLVTLFFMNLRYDRRENGLIFATSFLFLAIFIVITATDVFFRGDVYLKPGDFEKFSAAPGGSKLKNAWIATPELIARGREQFNAQCVACHGPNGQGNGPAAAALNPPPRNFTVNEGWKNGRKTTMVFKTLKEGLGGMPAFSSLPVDDRWALAHYVISLGPKPQPQDTPADFAKIGVDPTKSAGGGEEKAAEIPVDVAIERMSVKD